MQWWKQSPRPPTATRSATAKSLYQPWSRSCAYVPAKHANQIYKSNKFKIGDQEMEANIYHLQYALDACYRTVCGSLVMWRVAGFAILKSGLERANYTIEILTNNIALYSIANTRYLV